MDSKDLPTNLVAPVAFSGRRLVVSLDGAVAMFDLPATGKLVVGRSSESDIVLDHPSISRKHFALEIGDSVRIEDLGSANGTTVAGKRLAASSPVVLPPGMLVNVDTILITLQDARETTVEQTQDMIVEDAAMVEVLGLVRTAASSPLSVLLLGETGVGKEVFARRVHELSNRASGPLVRINCAALVESLLEAELFGYERGAFTGATQAKPGLVEAASGGTLFLDEVGELPLATQAKLLRVLESGEVTRVGALKPRSVDVRFVAATHRDLKTLVGAGKFREDLFFRLDGVSIRIPPLRERVSEILPLAQSFVNATAKEAGRVPPTIGPDAAAKLKSHAWPGNVRELRNVMQRSVIFCQGPQLGDKDLRFEALGAPKAPAPEATRSADDPRAESGAPAGMSPERAERRKRVIEALEKTVWNQTKAADLLGISRRTLQSWMIDLAIPRPRTGR